MKKIIYILAVCFTLYSYGAANAQTVRYVSEDGPNKSNPAQATTWATATDDLQGAIDASRIGDQVWVTKGTYLPRVKLVNNYWTGASYEQDKTFLITKGIGLYGGFDGTEKALDQRKPEKNTTILSGDIGMPGDNSDNAFHVLVVGLTRTSVDKQSEKVVIDGFHFTGGNARNNMGQMGVEGLKGELQRNHGSAILVSQLTVMDKQYSLTTEISNNKFYGNILPPVPGGASSVSGAIHVENHTGGWADEHATTVTIRDNELYDNTTGIGAIISTRPNGYTTLNIENNKLYNMERAIYVTADAYKLSSATTHFEHDNEGYTEINVIGNDVSKLNGNRGAGNGLAVYADAYSDVKDKTKFKINILKNKVDQNNNLGGITASAYMAIAQIDFNINDNIITNNKNQERNYYTSGIKAELQYSSNTQENVSMKIQNNELGGNIGLTNMQAPSQGGGLSVYVHNKSNSLVSSKRNVNISNNFIYKNKAQKGGGLSLKANGFASIEVLSNTIVANDAASTLGFLLTTERDYRGNIDIINNIAWSETKDQNVFGYDLSGIGYVTYKNNLFRGVSAEELNGDKGENNLDGRRENPLANKDDIFIDYDGGNYRIQNNSLPADAGNKDYWQGGNTDWDGLPRLMGKNMDLGIFECPWASVYIESRRIPFDDTPHSLDLIGWDSKIGELATKTEISPQSVKNPGLHNFSARMKMKNANHALLYPEMELTATLEIVDIQINLDYLIVNGDKVYEKDGRFSYVIPEEETKDKISIAAMKPSIIQVDRLPETYTIGEPGFETLSFRITDTQEDVSRDCILEIEKRFAFDELVVTRWNSVLTVINNPDSHGYTFSAYQWYKNGEKLDGETGQSYSVGNKGVELNPNDRYYVEVVDANTDRLMRCWEKKAKLKSQTVKAYPNPAVQFENITIDADIEEELLENAKIEIYSSTGVKHYEQTIEGRITQIVTPNASGIYVIRFSAKNGFTKDLKLIVK